MTSLVRRGDTIWLGGSFSRVGTVAGNAAIVDSASGAVVVRTPRFDDQVHASVPDGAGGWYVGGSFETVDGARLPYLVRLRPDGTVDPSFTLQTDAPVMDLEVSGSHLYLAGAFHHVGRTARSGIARITTATGVLDTTWAPAVRWPVTYIAVDSVGGRVVSVEQSIVLRSDAGQEHNLGFSTRRLGAYRLGGTGARDASVPRNGQPDEDLATVAAGGGRIFIAGYHNIAAYDAATMRIISRWGTTRGFVRSGASGGVVHAMLVSGDQLIVGGKIKGAGISGDPANSKLMVQGVTVMDAATGIWAAHQPRVLTGDVRSLAVDGSTLYVGGIFSHARPNDLVDTEAPRANAAAFNLVTGELLPWHPDPGSSVEALSVSGDGRVLVAGTFTTIGERQRSGLAAIDAVTGALREDFVADLSRWRNESYGIGDDFWHTTPVSSLELVEDRLVVGGQFSRVNGVPARHFAVLNPSTGSVHRGMPSASGLSVMQNNFEDGSITDVVPLGSGKVLVTGSFARIGRAARPAAAIVDVRTGRVLPWRQRVAGRFPRVYDAVAVGRSIWVSIGVAKTGIGWDTTTVQKLVVLDSVTGRVVAMPRLPDRWYTWDLATDGRRIWVAGGFSGEVSLRDREAILEFDASTNRLRRSMYSGRRGASHDTLVMGAYGETLVVGGSAGSLGSITDVFGPRPFTTLQDANESSMLRVVDLRTGRFRSLPIDSWQDMLGRHSGYDDGTTDTSTAPDHAHGERVGSGVYALDLSDGVLAVGGDFTGAAGRAQPFFALFGEVKNATPVCEDGELATIQGVTASVAVTCDDTDQPLLAYSLEQVPAWLAAEVTATPIGATLRVTPTLDAPVGQVPVMVRATDRHGASTTATVVLTVHARNVSPGGETGCGDLAFEIRDDIPTRLEFDCNGLRTGLTWSAPSDPAHGRLNQFDAAAGTVRFIPTERYAGPDEFTVQVRNGESEPVTVQIRLMIISVRGTSGNDDLHGGGGADRINGGAGRDTIDGGGGPDRLIGGSGNDRIRGGEGADQINATVGRDDVDAGTGNDQIVAVDGEKDVVRCGRGKDIARIDAIDVATGCERLIRIQLRSDDPT